MIQETKHSRFEPIWPDPFPNPAVPVGILPSFNLLRVTWLEELFYPPPPVLTKKIARLSTHAHARIYATAQYADTLLNYIHADWQVKNGLFCKLKQ